MISCVKEWLNLFPRPPSWFTIVTFYRYFTTPTVSQRPKVSINKQMKEIEQQVVNYIEKTFDYIEKIGRTFKKKHK